MIVLKILLWIVLAVLGIILLFLIIPVGAEVAYIDKKITYKIIYGFVNIYDSEKKGIAVKFIDRFLKKKHDNADDDDNDDSGSFESLDDIEDNIEATLLPEPDEIYDNTDSAEEEDIAEDVAEDDTIDETETHEESSDKPEKNGNSLADKFDKYESKIEILLDMLRSADRPLIHLFKGVKFSRIYIDFMITGDDAYKCAMNYGRISGAVYNILGWLATVCTADFQTVDVFPDFKAKESKWDISAKLSFKFITPIVAGIYFLITYMFRFFIPQKLQERKLKKSRKSKK